MAAEHRPHWRDKGSYAKKLNFPGGLPITDGLRLVFTLFGQRIVAYTAGELVDGELLPRWWVLLDGEEDPRDRRACALGAKFSNAIAMCKLMWGGTSTTKWCSATVLQLTGKDGALKPSGAAALEKLRRTFEGKGSGAMRRSYLEYCCCAEIGGVLAAVMRDARRGAAGVRRRAAPRTPEHVH